MGDNLISGISVEFETIRDVKKLFPEGLSEQYSNSKKVIIPFLLISF